MIAVSDAMDLRASHRRPPVLWHAAYQSALLAGALASWLPAMDFGYAESLLKSISTLDSAGRRPRCFRQRAALRGFARSVEEPAPVGFGVD